MKIEENQPMERLQSPETTYTDSKASIEPMSDGQGSTFAVLRVPSFAWFLTGTTLTNAAFWIQQVTLSWLVYDLTSSGTMLGTLNLVRSFATVGLATVAGVAIDRFSQRRLLYATNLWLFIVCFSFGLGFLGNPTVTWPLFLFSFLGGVGQAVSGPLLQTVVFSIVPRSMTPSAVALVQTGWAIMRSIGPTLGGYLILWFGPTGNFFVQAAVYALATLTIARLRFPHKEPQVEPTTAHGGFREGWTYIRSEPTTLAFLLMSWILPLFIIPNFNALPPIYAKDVFDGGPDTLGMLLSAVGLGGIVGGFVTTALGKLERRGLLQLGALLSLSLTFIAFAISSAFWMAIVCMALAGFFEMIYLTTNQTSIQLSIPDALRGRVTSIASLSFGLMPVGSFIAGVGADLVGPRTMTLIFGGILGVIAVIVTIAFPIIREYRLSQALDAEDTLA